MLLYLISIKFSRKIVHRLVTNIDNLLFALKILLDTLQQFVGNKAIKLWIIELKKTFLFIF